MSTPPNPPPGEPNPTKRPPSTQDDYAWSRARRTVLSEWRRVDWVPLERAWARAARPSAEVVGGVVKNLRLDQRKAEAEILKVWNQLLDPHVATHAQPVGLRHGTLFVNVDSSVWLSEIVRYRQREILERLQASFGARVIRRISFRQG